MDFMSTKIFDMYSIRALFNLSTLGLFKHPLMTRVRTFLCSPAFSLCFFLIEASVSRLVS